jgi:P27 family predicted phage terminase small subunit
MAENLPVRPSRTGAGPPDNRLPKPPRHLSRESKSIWRDVLTGWLIDAPSLPLLQGGLESWDQYQVARAEVRRDGPTVRSAGMVRVHPAVKVANDSLTQFRQCWRQLGLEPLDEEDVPYA